MVTTSQIRKSKHFKKLPKVQKLIITNKNNVRQIELGVNMSRLKSFKYWVKVVNPRKCIRLIVKELK